MKRSLLFLTIILFGSAPLVYAQAPIDRLFFTSDERARLDRMREHGVPDNALSTEVMPEKEITPPPEQLTLDGFVKRSSGKNTAWINQEPHNEDRNRQGTLVLGKRMKSSTVSVQLPSGGEVHLLPGQTFDIVRGKVREAFDNVPQKNALPDGQP